MLLLVHHHWLNTPTVKQTVLDLRTVYPELTIVDCDQLSAGTIRQYFTEHGSKPVWLIAPDAPESITQRTVGTQIDWLQEFETRRHGVVVSTHVKTLEALPVRVHDLMESVCLLS